ncbi:hypothetical protein [Enterocloster asparagiformis]|nr:hypothetical protein [Enterocloster asparagiformis]
MKLWSVVVYASEKIDVEAETEDQAKERAAEESNFSAVDYCEIDEIQ